MPSPHTGSTTSFSSAGPSRQPQQQQQQQSHLYQKQHRLSRSFPTSTSHLAPRYPTPTGTRSDRQQSPVSSSLGSRLDTGTSFPRRTPSPLPRTSSLLPPPHLAPSQPLTAQFDALNNNAAADSDSLFLRPTTSHSRSSSAGLSTEGFKNLNRWSTSTSSSRASGLNHRASNFYARRMSVDAAAFVANSSPQRPLRTRRRSNSSEASQPVGSALKLRGYSPPGSTRVEGLSTVFAPYPLDSSLSTDPAGAANGPSVPLGAPRAPRSGHIAEQNRPWDAFSSPDRRGSAEPGSQQPLRAMMPADRNGGAYDTRGHSRNRSQAAKGSTDTTASSKGRERGNKPPSQKAMLSRALQKANTAVQLDNAQNFEGARQAYAEACELLHQVLARTSTEEDKRKLEAIVSILTWNGVTVRS